MSLEKIEALEARITKVVELVKGLKDEKVRLSAENARLVEELSAMKAVEEENARLRNEKDQVRERLEKVLLGIEEIVP